MYREDEPIWHGSKPPTPLIPAARLVRSPDPRKEMSQNLEGWNNNSQINSRPSSLGTSIHRVHTSDQDT